ncbi:MAG: class I SAM-dependent methyltransferase [Gammaproteobacteria bacterium]|nr:class I SAM-dependent methyltransferase [Gammaproteobacteria bacterium]
MSRKEYTDANRIAWNEAGPIHKASTFEELKHAFTKPDYSYLDEKESNLLRDIGIEGKSVAQLCCNNGRELLSVKNMGAGRCVGFDISAEFIAQAKEFNKVAGHDCEFLATDIYDIPDAYNGQFDLVYITVGVIKLLPEMEGLFQTISRLLRVGGKLFIYEMHPILDMFDWNDKNHPATIINSYFDLNTTEHTLVCNYWDMSDYDSSPMYTFHHKMSDIIGGALQNGLTLESFNEYSYDRSNMYASFEQHKLRLPLSYSLVAQKR